MNEENFARLEKQVQFIREIDRLKQIVRQTYLMDGSRKENDAEHSWHLAMMAMLLAEHGDGPVNVLHVTKMVLIHDIVEIDAGDTYCYDAAAHHDKAAREQCAADRLFNLLPPDQAREMRALWDEFEAGTTPEARFAAALDRLQPMLQNYFTKGKSWQEHGVAAPRIRVRMAPMEHGAQILWEYTLRLIEDAENRGWTAKE